MSDISASLVKELREKTGIGIMDCKRALVETKGDITLAIEGLRKSSGVKASKKAGRSTADGIIATCSDGSKGFMVEINCETDFVTKDELFIEFTEDVIAALSSGNYRNVDDLMKGDLEDKREKLVQKLGENIVVRRISKNYDSYDNLGLYLHSNKKIACLVHLEGGDSEIAKDIAMHVAATDPLAISSNDIPKEIIDKEKEIYEANSAETGKPQDIINKMVEGKLKKYFAEVSLNDQDFVKESGIKIRTLLKKNKAKVLAFERFEVGEGVEIEETDFVTEVMSQIKNI